MTTNLSEFIDRAIEQNPIEAEILRRLIRRFADAGIPITHVHDSESIEPVATEREIFELVFNLDECWLMPEGGGWVRLVMGNEQDCIVDYTIPLESTIAPVNDWIEKTWG